MEKKLAILRNDPWLEPYAGAIEGRHHDVVRKLEELTANTDARLTTNSTIYTAIRLCLFCFSSIPFPPRCVRCPFQSDL